MRKMILGIFPNHDDADKALMDLQDEGFPSEEISIIAREEYLKKYRAEGSATVTGSVLGGIAGLLIAVTPVVVPGIGILVAGPLTVLAGLAMGALTGGLIGALIDAGIPEESARVYERAIQKGGVLLAVVVDDQTESTADEILRDHHAEEITAIPYHEKAQVARQTLPKNVSYQNRVSKPKRKT